MGYFSFRLESSFSDSVFHSAFSAVSPWRTFSRKIFSERMTASILSQFTGSSCWYHANHRSGWRQTPGAPFPTYTRIRPNMTQNAPGCLAILLGFFSSSKTHSNDDSAAERDIHTAELPWPVTKRPFITQNEAEFLEALRIAVGPNLIVFPNARLLDAVSVIPGSPNYYAYHNRMKGHIDFLLCTDQTYEPVLAIELDDSSHRSRKAQRRDTNKNNALQSADIPLVRFKARSKYDAPHLRMRIREALNK